MMIESIQFQNFKALRDTTLPLGRCTVLVGPNGSGKTTVLQAIEIFRSWQPFGQNFVSADLRQDESSKAKVLLHWAKPYKGIVEVRKNDCSGTRTGKEIDGKHDEEINLKLHTLISKMRIFSFDANAIATPVSLQPNFELASDGAGLASVLTRLRDMERERFDALEEELGVWLPEFDQVDFDIQGDKRVFLLRTREGHYKIPASNLSQGTLLALAMLTLAHLPEPPSLIGLEEPDHGVHPHLLRLVRDTLYRLSNPESCGEDRDPVQVIATTHSPCFIDLFKDFPEEIVVANKVGADVQFQRLTDQPNFEDILGDASLGEVWYTGFLGGVPSGS